MLDEKELEKQMQSAVMEKGFYEFFRTMWPAIESSDLSENWHLNYLADRLDALFKGYVRDRDLFKRYNQDVSRLKENDDYKKAILENRRVEFETQHFPKIPSRSTKHLIINVPPRSSKSVMTSVMFPTWCWVNDMSLKFLCISYNQDLANQLAKKCRDILSSNLFEYYFGARIRLTDSKAKQEFSVCDPNNARTTSGYRIARGMESQITGSGGDIVILDDPAKPLDEQSSFDKRNISDSVGIFKNTVRSRLDNPTWGIFVLIMQRLTESDLTGYLTTSEEAQDWDHINLPAELSSPAAKVIPVELETEYHRVEYNNEHWQILDRVRLPPSELIKKRRSMGADYWAQYAQMPYNPDTAIIQKRWIKYFDKTPTEIGNYFIFVDPAFTEDKRNDPSGLLICFYQYESSPEYPSGIYVVLAESVHKDITNLCPYIASLSRRFHSGGDNAIVYIEPKGSGKAVFSTIQKQCDDVPVLEIPSRYVEKDKTSKISAKRPFVEQGQLHLLKGDWNENFIEELVGYPRARRDDLVDCLVYAFDIYKDYTRIRLGSIDLSRKEREQNPLNPLNVRGLDLGDEDGQLNLFKLNAQGSELLKQLRRSQGSG